METVSISAELGGTRRVALIEPVKRNQAARLEAVRSGRIVHLVVSLGTCCSQEDQRISNMLATLT